MLVFFIGLTFESVHDLCGRKPVPVFRAPALPDALGKNAFCFFSACCFRDMFPHDRSPRKIKVPIRCWCRAWLTRSMVCSLVTMYLLGSDSTSRYPYLHLRVRFLCFFSPRARVVSRWYLRCCRCSFSSSGFCWFSFIVSLNNMFWTSVFPFTCRRHICYVCSSIRFVSFRFV